MFSWASDKTQVNNVMSNVIWWLINNQNNWGMIGYLLSSYEIHTSWWEWLLKVTCVFWPAARNSEERGPVSDGCSHHTPSLVRRVFGWYKRQEYSTPKQINMDVIINCCHWSGTTLGGMRLCWRMFLAWGCMEETTGLGVWQIKSPTLRNSRCPQSDRSKSSLPGQSFFLVRLAAQKYRFSSLSALLSFDVLFSPFAV